MDKTILQKNTTGVQHIGIPTNDIEKTISFYEGLGFELTYRTANGDEQVAFLQLKNLVIETYQNNMATLRDGAIDHIAIDAKNISELFEAIQSAGYKLLTERIQSLPFWENGIQYFIIEGPNAERLEFCEKF
ncbi:MAG: VOC family protein [Tannerellaceae bacterium]|nr:VOC family protein [Tannerellaceae bacterium]